MTYGDYSAGKPSGAALWNAGFRGVCRYAGTPGRTKNTTAADVAQLKRAGLAVCGVYENTTTDFTGGYNAGVANAKKLLADANACGITGVLFMSADQHLSASQLTVWKQYLTGAKTVLGDRCGAYGFSEAVAAAKTVGIAHIWQCGSRSALVSGANLYQRNSGQSSVVVGGVAVDVNDVINPFTEVPDVALTADDIDMIFNRTQFTKQGTGQTGTISLGSLLAWFDNNVSSIKSAVSAEQAAVVAAIQALPTGQPPTDAQMAALTAAVVAALPTGGYDVSITPKAVA